MQPAHFQIVLMYVMGQVLVVFAGLQDAPKRSSAACQVHESGSSPPVDVAELLEDDEAEDCSSLRPLEEDTAELAASEVALSSCTAVVASARACMQSSCWSARPGSSPWTARAPSAITKYCKSW